MGQLRSWRPLGVTVKLPFKARHTSTIAGSYGTHNQGAYLPE